VEGLKLVQKLDQVLETATKPVRHRGAFDQCERCHYGRESRCERYSWHRP
jgi:hypothetical protein